MRLANKHFILTDGVSSVGLAIARRLMARGASISLIGSERVVLAEAAEALQPLARFPHQQIGIVAANLAVEADIQQAIGDLIRRLGSCDALIATTMIGRTVPFYELDPAMVHQAMDVGYFGVVAAIQAVLPAMIARRSGALIMLTSTAGMLDGAHYAAYGPARLAVQGLVDSLRSELREFNINVSMAYIEPEQTTHARTIETTAQAIVKGIAKGRPTISTRWQGALMMRFGRMLHPMLRRQLARRNSEEPPLAS